MKRILITGAAGFLGSHLCDRFIAEGYYVIGMDNLITGDLKNIEHIGNRNKFIKEFKAKTEPEAIFKACEWILENKDYK